MRYITSPNAAPVVLLSVDCFAFLLFFFFVLVLLVILCTLCSYVDIIQVRDSFRLIDSSPVQILLSNFDKSSGI